jgi:hypothetical protein
MQPASKPRPTIADDAEPMGMTSEADKRRTSIPRGDGGQRWSPLANHMGYTRTPEQREAILAAIRRMTWIAAQPPHASPLPHIGPAARTLAAALTHRAPPRRAAIAPLQAGHTLIGLTDTTGTRHYLIDLRHEAIYVLTQPDPTPRRMPSHQRHHHRSPATRGQSERIPAPSAPILEALSQAGVTGRQHKCRTTP